MKVIKKQLVEDINDAVRFDDEGEVSAMRDSQNEADDYTKLAKVINNALDVAARNARISKAGVYAQVEDDGVVIDVASKSDITNILEIVRNVIKLATKYTYEITIYGNEIVVSHSNISAKTEDFHAAEFDNYDDDIEALSYDLDQDYDDDADDDDFDWDEYEAALNLDDDISDEEADRAHANLFGGDRTYCDCGTKLVYGEDGYSYCPKCSPVDLGEELSNSEKLKKAFPELNIDTEDNLDESLLTEAEKKYKPHTQRLLKLIRSSKVDECAETSETLAKEEKPLNETTRNFKPSTIRLLKMIGSDLVSSDSTDDITETLDEGVDYDSPIEVLKDHILLVDEIYDMAQISGPVVDDVTSLSEEETIQLAKDMLADGEERKNRIGKPMPFLAIALKKLQAALDDCTKTPTESALVESTDMSFEAIVADAIKHVATDLGYSPSDEDFGEKVVDDIENNYNVDIPSDRDRYSSWVSAILCEVSRQLNNPDNDVKL